MLDAILNSNPFITLLVGVVIVFILMFIFVRPDKKKKSTKESSKNKDEAKATEKKEKDDDLVKKTIEEPEAQVDVSKSEEIKPPKKKVKKAKTKPEINQVYQRTEKKQQVEEKTSDDGISDELLSKAQFVNTSKSISKFVGFASNKDENIGEDGLEINEGVIEEISKNCDDCKRIVTHFDHSRRLSKIIKDDSFDQMFMEHLTDHYLNIDVDKHLRNIDEKIFERASTMLSNSDTKVLVESDSSDIPAEKIKNDKDFMRSWLENRRLQEQQVMMSSSNNEEQIDEAKEKMIVNDLKITAKNLVVASAIMQRKGMKHNKK